MYAKGDMHKCTEAFSIYIYIYMNRDSIHMHNIDASSLINQ